MNDKKAGIMITSDPKIIVSTDWLAQNLSSPNIRILDGSWHLPTENRDPFAEFTTEHIQGAQFFDIDDICDTTSDLPHMIPSADQFAQQVAALGISDDSQVVVYGTVGLFSAARVWWLFHYFGHTNVAVLDGGLKQWKAQGHDTTNQLAVAQPAQLSATAQPHMERKAVDVLDASQTQSAQILDARAPARFRGEAPEPRAGLRAGHMPNAINVFFKSLLNEDGTLQSDAALKATFESQGVDLNKPIITSCGSGVTASVLMLALHKIGHTDNALYDGSWSEWGGLSEYPVEQG